MYSLLAASSPNIKAFLNGQSSVLKSPLVPMVELLIPYLDDVVYSGLPTHN